MSTEILILGLAVLLGFFVQTVFGFAASLVALPITLTVLSLQDSVAFLAIYLFLFSVVLVYQTYELIDKKTVLHLSFGGGIGIFLGVLTLKVADPRVLIKLLGLFTMLFVVNQLINKKKIAVLKKLGTAFALAGGFFLRSLQFWWATHRHLSLQ